MTPLEYARLMEILARGWQEIRNNPNLVQNALRPDTLFKGAPTPAQYTRHPAEHPSYKRCGPCP